MKLLSLKTVYEDLMFEAIIDQGSFLSRLIKVIHKRIEKESNYDYGDLLSKLVQITKETGLLNLKDEQDVIQRSSSLMRSASKLPFDLTSEEDFTQHRSISNLNKKARKKAEVLIHKELKKIKGIDGTPIDLKKMRPLYDSIIQFINSKKDIDLEHCFLAADYYMKSFYSNADADFKKEVDDGNISFDKILEITKFYKQYYEFKEEIGLYEDRSVVVYDDKEIKIVFPLSSESFNRFINKSGSSVSWCTQSPITWQSYNKQWFVMILQDKVGDQGIWSLKVDFSGYVNYYETCNVRNNHMDEASVKTLLSDKAEAAILEKVRNKDVEEGVTNEYDPDRALRYLKALLDRNNAQEVLNMMISVFDNDPNGQTFIDIISEFLVYADGIDRLEYAIEIYADALSGLNFDGRDVMHSICRTPLKQYGSYERKFFGVLYNKSMSKRSHVKYFICLADFFIDKSTDHKYMNPIRNNITDLVFIALDKSNPVNFVKALSSMSSNSYIRNTCLQQNSFPQFFNTKGFKVYIKEKKQNVRSITTLNMDHPMGNATEKIVSTLIDRNLEAFKNSFQELNNAGEINVSLEDIDLSLISRLIVHRTNFMSYDVLDMNLESISDSTFEIKEQTLNDIENTIYTDLGLVKIMCENYPPLSDSLIKHYFSKVDFKVKSQRKNKTIKFNSQSYEIFSYLISNSNMIVDVINDEKTPGVTLKVFSLIVELLNSFGKSPESIDANVENILLGIANTKKIYQSFCIDDIRKVNFINLNNVEYFSNIMGKVEFRDKQINNIADSIKDNKMLEKISSNNPFEILISRLVKLDKVKNKILSNINKSNIKYDELYAGLYVVNYNTLTIPMLQKFFVNYVNIVSNTHYFTSQGFAELYNKYFNKTACEKVNKLITSTITINTQITDSIGRLIDRYDIYNTEGFLSLIIELVKKCNEQGITFNKEHLSELIYGMRFETVDDADRHEVLTNFITMGSNNEKNYLDTKKRVLVRDCLKKCLKSGNKHLSQDYDFIMSLCKDLDHYTKFQLRTVFPNEPLLAVSEEDVNEYLIRNYIKLFFS
tara:strand:- start:1229 stop:4390 length:3162 start_codon:yes stop_codon:yes gene_type:complete